MAAPGIAAISVSLEGYSGSGKVATPALLAAMLRAAEKISDLIFSPGRPPQVQVYGQLIPVQIPGLQTLLPMTRAHIAADLIGDNKQAVATLREHGSCDISYGLPGVARFRVNIFIQRGSCAVVMRVISTSIPDLASLGLPRASGGRRQVARWHRARHRARPVQANPPLWPCFSTASIARSTTTSSPSKIPSSSCITTSARTIHQRELHSDTPSFAHALRSALRQAPKVILVGEMRDRETIEIVLEAAETGHLVLSSLNTMDALENR